MKEANPPFHTSFNNKYKQSEGSNLGVDTDAATTAAQVTPRTVEQEIKQVL